MDSASGYGNYDFDDDGYGEAEETVKKEHWWITRVIMGEFDDDPTLSVIVADCVISCFPIAGTVTSGRDLVAILLRWYHFQQKMREVLEWVALIGCVVGLIPALGGPVKAVMRFLARETKTVLTKFPKLIALLNRLGVGNAERWVKELQFLRHAPEIEKALTDFVDKLTRVLQRIRDAEVVFVDAYLRPASVYLFPTSLRLKVEYLRHWLLQEFRPIIPENVRKTLAWLDEKLAEVKRIIDEAGTNASKETEHIHTPGKEGPTHPAEASASREPPPEPNLGKTGYEALNKDAREAWMANNAKARAEVPSFREKDLMNFATAPEKVSLREEKSIWRVFGESKDNPVLAKANNGELAGDAKAGGSWWGTGPAPQSAKEWREPSAVLDSFNADGKMIKISVKEGDISCLKGKVALKNEHGQFLPGGGSQAYIDYNIAQEIDAKINKAVGDAKAPGSFKGTITLDNGTKLEFEIRDTGWKDANGTYGWPQEASNLTSYYIIPLAPTEIRVKDEEIA